MYSIYMWKHCISDDLATVDMEGFYIRSEGLAKRRRPVVVRPSRVALHADLTMLARLSLALARARAVPLAA
jgi:predicted metalloprotease